MASYGNENRQDFTLEDFIKQAKNGKRNKKKNKKEKINGTDEKSEHVYKSLFADVTKVLPKTKKNNKKEKNEYTSIPTSVTMNDIVASRKEKNEYTPIPTSVTMNDMVYFHTYKYLMESRMELVKQGVMRENKELEDDFKHFLSLCQNVI